jgi:hypothetical protein
MLINSAAAIDHIRPPDKLHDEYIGVCYFYLKYDDKDQQSGKQVVRSLLKQLVSQKHQLSEALKTMYKNDQCGTPPRTESLRDLLCSYSKEFNSVYVFLDGLDECTDEQRKEIMKLILTLCDSDAVMRVMLTSQPHFEHDIDKLGEELEKATYLKLEIAANERDLERYVTLKLKENGQLHLKDALLKSLMDGNDGM